MNATATVAPADRAGVPHDRAGGAGGPQYMQALERANKVRLARAELKRRVAQGEIGVAAVILDCPWEAHSMAVADLLMSQRRWGQTRCRKFLTQFSMPEKKTLGSMTDRQRRTLAAMLAAAPQSRDQAAALDLRAGGLSPQPSGLECRPYQALPAPPRHLSPRDLRELPPRERRAMALSR